jgi:hypothetical protein
MGVLTITCQKRNINWREFKSNITANVCAALRKASRQLGYEACTVSIKSGKERWHDEK